MKNKGRLIILTGLPGSGKSTEANKLLRKNLLLPIKVVRINRSSLRNMLWPGHIWSKEYESLVREVEYNLASFFLYSNYDVIIDSTNLNDKGVNSINRWKKLRKNLTVIDLREVPLEVCLKRDMERKENKIGPEVIIKLARTNKLLK